MIVSHDRALLERTVTSVLEIDPRSRGVTEWTGRWGEYTARRETERRAASEQYEQAVARRRHLTELTSTRRSEARARGDSLGRATGGADRRATNALRTKVRQAQRLLERNELPEKPFEPWELRLVLQAGARTGELVARLEEAVVERGSFRLGPITLDLVPGERLALTGANGTGKTTLLQALLGELPLASGRRRVGGATRMGVLTQERTAYAGDERTLDEFVARTGLEAEPARTLLAKFGLGAEHAHRPSSSLSPGERTRAQLAELQALRVNLLVLDEPTNHLDLEAVEQLESALSGYDGTLVVVSHDRRFLEISGSDEGNRAAAIVRSRSWPSPSVRRRGRGATSDAHSTGSPSRASSSARRASSPSGPIASARAARRTRAGTSSRFASKLRRYSTHG